MLLITILETHNVKQNLEFFTVISSLYPQHDWNYKYNHFSIKEWKTPEFLRNFFEYCEKRLIITKPDDWYNVTLSQVELLGGIY